MKRDTQQFSINANHLLNALRAVMPLASRDAKELPHLTQVRWVLSTVQLELSATDGHALGRVVAPLEHSEADGLNFCVQTSFLPTLTKALSRVKDEQRRELVVDFVVSRFRIEVAIADWGVVIPNAAEQLLFPDIEKCIPIPSTSHRTAVTTYGVNPSLLARVMKAASKITVSVQHTAPESPLSPIRFDVVDGEGALAGTYVVMPMRMGEADEAPSAQSELAGTQREPKDDKAPSLSRVKEASVEGAVEDFLKTIPKDTTVTISGTTNGKKRPPVTVQGKGPAKAAKPAKAKAPKPKARKR